MSESIKDLERTLAEFAKLHHKIGEQHEELTRLKELNREMVEAFTQLLELRGNKSRGAFSLTVTMEKWETAWDKMKKIVSKASEVER